MRLRNRYAKLSTPLPRLIMVGQVVSSLCKVHAYGIVLARFERCAYLQFNSQLICVGLNELGAGSITGLFDHTVHTLPQSLSIGASVELSTTYLVIDDRYFIDLHGAALYAPALRDNAQRHATTPTQHELLANLAIPTTGLAPLLRRVADAAIDARTENVIGISAVEKMSTESHLLGFTMPAIVLLAHQIRFNCVSKGTDAASIEFDSALFQKLVGAGPGLTPSGDDLLCGVFTALRLSGFADVASSLWNSIREFAMLSTTPVSFAMLEQAALGDCGERLETVVRAYYNYPSTAAHDFQQLVDMIGETSGWDWLTGFVLCSDILWRNQLKTAAAS